MKDELLEALDDDIEENTNKKSKSKKSDKKEKKFTTKTISDLYKDRMDLISRYWKLLLGIGFIILILYALIKTIALQTQRASIKHHDTKKEIPKIELGVESKTWKKVVEDKINNIDKNVTNKLNHFTDLITEELNKTVFNVNNLIQENNNKIMSQLQSTNSNISQINQKINILDTKIQKNSEAINYLKQHKPITTPNNPNVPPLKPIFLPTTKDKEKKYNPNNGLPLPNKTLNSKENNKKETAQPIEEEITVENDALQSTIINEQELKKINTPKKKEEVKMAMKMGFADAILVTGVSAPTFNGGAANPKPILLSLVGDAYLANDYKANLDGCMAIATATGNIITSRAEMLITKISCNYEKDGEMYELTMPVKGWVIGADGQYGVTGKLVDSSGKILSQSMLIGIAQGVAQSISQATLQAATNSANNGTATTNISTVFKQNTLVGAANGFSSGFNVILDYYKKIMDAYFPYISVKAGKSVTILFNGGEAATSKKVAPIDIHKQETDENIENETDIIIENDDF